MGSDLSTQSRDQRISNDQYQSDYINQELDQLFTDNPDIDHSKYDNAVEKANLEIKQDLENKEAEHRQKYEQALAIKTAQQDKTFGNFNKVVDDGFEDVQTPFNIAFDATSTLESSLASLGLDFGDDLPYIIAGVVMVAGVAYYVYTQNKDDVKQYILASR